VQVFSPNLLPGLGGQPQKQVAEVKTPPSPQPARSPVPSAQYVALLQKDSGSPAFILTVDGTTKNFTVRRVGATPEPGKSYELWLVSNKPIITYTAGQSLKSFTSVSTGDFEGNVKPAVPEPASWALMLMGVGGLGGMLRARRKAVAA